MTERKFKSYTLWMKWRNLGWRPQATVSNLPWPADNPIDILKKWVESRYFYKHWVRGKTWVILPEGREPKGGE